VAFVVRTVSHSAEGREIVRSRRVETETLTIGRGPASDVHLTDLAVALRHAMVERRGAQLAIICEPGLTVEFNGRKVARGETDVGTGAEIALASHLLRFMPAPPGAQEIALTVERITEGAAKLDKDGERLFSLAPVMPGKRAMAWLLMAAVLALCVAWPLKARHDRVQKAAAFSRFQADEMWSAGHLSRGHAALQHDCSACHVKPFESVRDTACLACHKAVHGHADPFRLAEAQPDLTSWGRLQLRVKHVFNLPPGRCLDCHREHEGAHDMPPTPQRFCSDCHANLTAKLPDTRFGNAGDFAHLHPAFRPIAVTGWDGERPVLRRVPLGVRAREQNGLRFPHALHLSSGNGVAQMARTLGMGRGLDCRNCHRPNRDGVRFRAVEMERNCAMCHDLAFDRVGGTVRTLRHGDPAQVIADLRALYGGRSAPAPANLSPFARTRPGTAAGEGARSRYIRFAAAPGADAAVRRVFSPGGACYDCHRVEVPPPGSLAYRIAPVAFPARYVQHGWFDHRSHATRSCVTCHAARTSNSASDLLLPDIGTCRTCHGGERTRKPVASSCAMCHDYHRDEGAPAMVIRQRISGERRQTPARIEGGR
jgi:hypothetical protein